MRRNVSVEAHKLDSYINSYTIKSIRQVLENYREEIVAEERKQDGVKDDFFSEEKTFKKIVSNLEKICKKGKEGIKYKDDLFVELVGFVNEEKVFNEKLIKYGKSTLVLRKNYMAAEKKLFN